MWPTFINTSCALHFLPVKIEFAGPVKSIIAGENQFCRWEWFLPVGMSNGNARLPHISIESKSIDTSTESSSFPSRGLSFSCHSAVWVNMYRVTAGSYCACDFEDFLSFETRGKCFRDAPFGVSWNWCLIGASNLEQVCSRSHKREKLKLQSKLGVRTARELDDSMGLYGFVGAIT